MTDIDEALKSLKGVPPEVIERARRSAPNIHKKIMEAVGKEVSGKVTYKSAKFSQIPDMLDWMNENRQTASVITILPDFQSYQYWLIYEEQTNG